MKTTNLKEVLNKRKIKEENLIMALKLGQIDWFQYLELFRKLEK